MKKEIKIPPFVERHAYLAKKGSKKVSTTKVRGGYLIKAYKKNKIECTLLDKEGEINGFWIEGNKKRNISLKSSRGY